MQLASCQPLLDILAFDILSSKSNFDMRMEMFETDYWQYSSHVTHKKGLFNQAKICWWIGCFLTPFWALHHVLRLQQKTVRHQQIKEVYSERIFLSNFLISDIVQQVKDRKLKAVFFKNKSFIKYTWTCTASVYN